MTPVFFGALFAIKHVAAQVVSPANIGAVKHVTARLLRNARAAIPVRGARRIGGWLEARSEAVHYRWRIHLGHRETVDSLTRATEDAPIPENRRK
jgi:hypothetical protein